MERERDEGEQAGRERERVGRERERGGNEREKNREMDSPSYLRSKRDCFLLRKTRSCASLIGTP